MEALYWITRFDALLGFFGSAAVLSVLYLIVSITAYHVVNLSTDFSPEDRYTKFWKKSLKVSTVLSTITLLGVLFIPNTKQAIAIYGIGGTVDYIKNDSTAQQLPHKVIEACSLYLNSILEESEIEDSL